MSSNDFLDRSRGPRIDLTTALAKDDDVLVIGLLTPANGDSGTAEGASSPTLVTGEDLVDDETAEALAAGLHALGATGAAGEVHRLPAPSSLPVRLVLAVGLGGADAVTDDGIRQAAGNAVRALDGAGTAVLTLAAAGEDPQAALAAAAEGAYLGGYRFDEFRSAKSAPATSAPAAVSLLVPAKTKEAKARLAQAVITAEAVALARDFVNTPPNVLCPAEFAERARAAGAAAGLDVEVLDEQALADGGYGGIVGVGQGSSRPPRLVRLSHRPAKPAASVALVGKGITFDTGGISIKPAANMDQMTSDMGGAAAVVATVIAAARLNLPVAVTATVPMAENMPSATAQRPGDVLTQYGGITVEVLNTDAEGRLILADAIVRACEDEPDYLIDTATLTGAQMVALGTRTPGVMGTTEFRDRVAALSQQVGENGWPMPMPPELRADLNSRVADLANVTNNRWGGMLAAATFLKEFVADGVAWAHVDVAGPAFNTSAPWGYTAKGGTGVPVRTMIAVLQDIAEHG